MKRAWILAAIGDIRGFRKWCRNPSTTAEIRQPLMRKFLKDVMDFGRKHKCQIKRAGDGFFFLVEFSMSKDKSKCMFRFLLELRDLTERMLKIVNESPWPQPEGFRLRITGGWVDVHSLDDGPEYIGEAPNLARELLYFKPIVPVVVHSSVIKRLTPTQIKELRTIHMPNTVKIKEIEAHDLAELWEVPLRNLGKNHK